MAKKTINVRCILAAAATFFLLAICFAGTVLAEEKKTTDRMYSVVMNYTKGLVDLEGITLLNKKAQERSDREEGKYTLNVTAMDGQLLETFKFNVPNVVCTDAPSADGKMEGGCREVDKAKFTLEVPYFANGKVIDVYGPDGKLAMSADVSNFSDLCGDGICQKNENYKTCQKDCRSGIADGVCDEVADGTCDPDCKDSQDPDCGKKTNALAVALIIICILAVSTMGYFAFNKLRKDQE